MTRNFYSKLLTSASSERELLYPNVSSPHMSNKAVKTAKICSRSLLSPPFTSRRRVEGGPAVWLAGWGSETECFKSSN